MKKNVFFAAIIFLGAFFLSGCGENQAQEQVLRNAEQYNINPNQNSGGDGSDAAKNLSVSSRQAGSVSNQASSSPNNSKQQPAMQIDQAKTYVATLKTDEGDIEITLDASRVPITVNNFVSLSRDGFYNGTIFHRVIKGFMIQGGDPEGNGTGGPGYSFDDENLEGEYVRGTIAMANSGPDTNGSQFFIMHADYALPNNYVIFGHVTNGMDVVDKIATAEVAMSSSGENSKPVNPVRVDSVEIIEK
ncbi:MAG: peptidylprolyl isomerase [Candidatus Moranbacteria bacterium]|nr:peptidylprolyl isomerase [Candidatus Moranbacteria bacterium]